MFRILILVFLGGGLGSVVRFWISGLVSRCVTGTFPLGTLGVNILGSLLIGLLWGIPAVAGNDNYSPLLIAGFCGGFTTFSAFSWENLTLLKQGEVGVFFLYAGLSVALCLLFTFLGYLLGKNIG